MLASLFGKKSDHPLADIKSVQQLLEVLPKADAFKALEEITGWIEELENRATEFRLDHQVAVLSLLDEAAQPYVRKLQRDYFTAQPLNKFQENLIWAVLNKFFKFSEQNYANIFAQCRKSVRAGDVGKLQLVLLASRAIVAVLNRMKLAAVRYEQIEPVLWVNLAAIYVFAEKNGFLDEIVTLYPGSGINTSARREFASAIVWYSVGTGSFAPLQIHIAERLIAHENKYLEVGLQAGEGSLWAINLAQPGTPFRASGEGTIHPSMRFFGVGGLKNGLNDLIRTLKKGVVPQELNLFGSVYDAEILDEVAHQLISRSASPPVTRKNARRKLSVNLQVSNGFQNLIDNADINLHLDNKGNTIWEVEDVSATGFCSAVASSQLEAVKIGTLIGSKPENLGHWGVGIVRRLSRDAQNNLLVGVEILTNQVIGVFLSVADSLRTQETDHLSLYLSKPNDNSGEAWLLMRPGIFLPSRSFKMTLEGKSYLLLSLGLVESGDDYDLARYRKMEQESSE